VTESIDIPPVVPCPSWCSQTLHPWEEDSGEWVRIHEGPLPLDRKLGVPVAAFLEDRWRDGVLERVECVVIGDVPIDRATWAAISRLLTT
jgi:hypothetical protein